MAEPATQYDPEPEDNDRKRLSAQERAAQRWGMGQEDSEEPKNQDDESDEDEETGSARERADKRWGMAPPEIKKAEESGGTDETKDANFDYREEASRLGKGGRLRGQFSRGQLIGAGAGLGGLLLGIIVLILFLSSLKVVHFGEVLAATGYARFNGIMEARTTQDIFDASLVEGDGSVSAQGRTLVDKIKLRNIDNQISALGREGKLSFIKGASDDSMAGVRVNGKAITFDDIAKQSGFGDNFSELKLRQKMTVRKIFVDNVQTSVGDALAEEPRYIRGRIFATIADDVGFSFSRWAQAGRNLFGKTPAEAQTQDTLNSVEEVSADQKISGLSGDVAKSVDKFKNADKLKAYLEKTGGTFDKDLFYQTATADIENAAKIQSAAATVSKGVILVSLACMANEAFAHVDQIQNNNETGATRQGLQLQAAKDQTKANAVTSIAEQTAAKQLDGAEASPYYQYDTNQPVSTAGQDIPRVAPKPSANNIGKIVTQITKPTNWGGGFIIRGIPGVGGLLDSIDSKFCGAVLSPGGAIAVGTLDTIVAAAVGFFTEGGGAAAEQGGEALAIQVFLSELGSAFLDTAGGLFGSVGALTKTAGTLAGFTAYALGLKLVAGSLAGTSFFGAEQKSSYYTNAAIGTSILQDRQVRAGYGKPLKPEEASQVDNHYVTLSRQSLQNQSVFARYFSPHNPYSLTGLASAQMPSGLTDGASIFRSIFGSIGKILQPTVFLKGLSSLLSPGSAKAFAADSFDPYDGLPQWGFSPDEINKMENDPSYNIYNNPSYISQSQIAAYDKSIGKCFDPARSQTEVDNDKDCSESNLSSDPVFRYRIYKMDNQLGDMAQEDLAHPSDGNSSSTTTPAPPTGSSIVGDIGESSDSVPCAAGTTDKGVVASQYTGGLKKTSGPIMIRLCQLSSIGNATVNSRVSGAWQALGAAAKAQGVGLTASSSFRLGSSCGGSGNGTLCAKPGQSIHQLGVAIDFAGTHVTGASSSSCSGRARDPSSPVWNWLFRYAEQFGFKQYTYESWHWDTLADPSRCGAGQ